MQLTIYIEALTFETIIGVLDHERTTPQTVIIDAEIAYEYRGIYLDYAQIARFFETTLQKKQFCTIEEALMQLSGSLKCNHASISSIKLKLSKPQIMGNCIPAVEIFKKY
jgi:dihydroneopterin aldolase